MQTEKNTPAPAESGRAAWMSGHWGLMVHWLYPGVPPRAGAPAGSLDEAVDRFNAARLLDQIASTGASWFLLTLGQNTGRYLSPNPVIEELAGPGHCSQRDLAYEIAAGMHRMGRRFIAYLPCEVSANTSLHAGFGWQTQDGGQQTVFQARYTRAVAAWARRFGPLLDGWWYDGCYTWPVFHNAGMDWPLWESASRAGNPRAALAFNDGSFCVGNLGPVYPGQDYLSGEAEMLVDGKIRLGRGLPVQTHIPGAQSAHLPAGCQWHALLPVDCFWMHGNPPPDFLPGHPYRAVGSAFASGPMEPPVYPDAVLDGFVRGCLAAGGAVTCNVGIYEDGLLGEETLAQLRRLPASR